MKGMTDGWLRAKATSPNIDNSAAEHARVSGEADYYAQELGKTRGELQRVSQQLEGARDTLDRVGNPDGNGLGTYIFLRVRAFRQRRLSEVKDPSRLPLETKRIVNLQMIAVAEYLLNWLHMYREYPKHLSAILEEEAAKPQADPQRLSAVSEALRNMSLTGHRENEKEWVKARLRDLKDQIRYEKPTDTVPTRASLGNPYPPGVEDNILRTDLLYELML